MPANPRFNQPVSVYPSGYDADDVEHILLDTTAGTATKWWTRLIPSHCNE